MGTWLKKMKITNIVLMVLGILSLILAALYFLGKYSGSKKEDTEVN